MSFTQSLKNYLLIGALIVAATPAYAEAFVSVNIAPPPLPVYEQPACPDDGYLWNPGFWGYGDFGYYWVPGTWVQPPEVNVLWTPGYWGWGDGGVYVFHGGYWGPHVGFYGGINYGFGYGGGGYYGGRWDGGHFAYNSSVTNVNRTSIHNTYIDKSTHVTNNTRNVSFNGGANGVKAEPTAEEKQAASERHIAPTKVQAAHVRVAAKDRNQLASVNGGKPATVASTRAESYRKTAHENARSRPLTEADKAKPTTEAANHPAEKSAEGAEHPKTEKAMAEKPAEKHATEEAKPAAEHHAQAEKRAVEHHAEAKKPAVEQHRPEAPKPAAQPHPEAKQAEKDKQSH